MQPNTPGDAAPQTTAEAIRVLAQAIGEDPSAIHAADAGWVHLMRQGLIVRIHLHRWRGRTSLSLDDIGVPLNGEQKLYEELLALGQKLLMPKEMLKELDAIDSGARKCAERHGYETFWGTFIPFTAYAAWKKDNERFRERYDAVRDRLIENYETIVANLMEKYQEAAYIAFYRRRLLQTEHAAGCTPLTEAQFVEAFMGRIRALIPTREEICASFLYDVELSYIPLPSLLAQDEAAADRIRLDRLKDRTELDAEEERQRLVTAMHRDVLDAARRQKQALITGFLKDIVAQLRALIYDAVTQIGDAVQRNGYLHPRSVVQLNTLIQRVEALNFFGDPDAEAMIEELRRIAETPAESRSAADIQDQLRQIAIVTRQSLLALGEQPRTARELGVADVPTVDSVRQARRALGLAEVEIVALPQARQARLGL